MDITKSEFNHDVLQSLQALYASHEPLLTDARYTRSRASFLALMKTVAAESQDSDDVATLKSLGKTPLGNTTSGRKRILNFAAKTDEKVVGGCDTGDCGGTTTVDPNNQLGAKDIRKNSGVVTQPKKEEFPHKAEAEEPEPIAGLDEALEAKGAVEVKTVAPGVTVKSEKIDLDDREGGATAHTKAVSIEDKVKTYEDIDQCQSGKEVALFYGWKNPKVKPADVVIALMSIVQSHDPVKYTEFNASDLTAARKIKAISSWIYDNHVKL